MLELDALRHSNSGFFFFGLPLHISNIRYIPYRILLSFFSQQALHKHNLKTLKFLSVA